MKRKLRNFVFTAYLHLIYRKPHFGLFKLSGILFSTTEQEEIPTFQSAVIRQFLKVDKKFELTYTRMTFANQKHIFRT